MDEEESAAISDRIAKGEYKQQILTHQHFYQVQVCDRVMVRWCVNCGKAWKNERYQDRSFGDFWDEILERDK